MPGKTTVIAKGQKETRYSFVIARIEIVYVENIKIELLISTEQLPPYLQT